MFHLRIFKSTATTITIIQGDQKFSVHLMIKIQKVTSNVSGGQFSASVQTGPGAHQASCTMGTGSFPVVEIGRGVTLTPHPFLVPRPIKQNRAIPLLYLRAFMAYKKGETYQQVIFKVSPASLH
jgi:hypothetical protein